MEKRSFFSEVFFSFSLAGLASLGAMTPRLEKSAIPSFAPPEVRAQIELLFHPDIQVRAKACLTLGGMGEKAAAAIPFLVTMLWGKAGVNIVHSSAIQALEKIGKPALEPINLCLKIAENRYYKGNCFRLLSQVRDESSTEAWADLFFREQGLDSRRAAPLVSLGKAAEVRLRLMLQSGDLHERKTAAKALGFFATPQAAEGLIQAMQDPDAGVRTIALENLREIVKVSGGILGPSLEKIALLLRDPHPQVRLSGPGLLASFCAQNAKANEEIPALWEKALRDEDSGVQLAALEALAGLKKSGPWNDILEDLLNDHFQPVLTKGIRDPYPPFRGKAARLATSFHDNGLSTQIASLVGDDDLANRIIAIQTLLALRPPDAFVAIAEALKDHEVAVREAAAVALGQMADRRAIPLLEAAQAERRGEKEEGFRRTATEALAKLKGLPPPPSQEDLTKGNPPPRKVESYTPVSVWSPLSAQKASSRPPPSLIRETPDKKDRKDPVAITEPVSSLLKKAASPKAAPDGMIPPTGLGPAGIAQLAHVLKTLNE